MSTCIFCRAPTNREPVEHVAPEGLVGHQPFTARVDSTIVEPHKFLVLDHDEVCRRCNHKLGSLDQYLQEQLGFIKTYLNPVGTKSGKRATARRPGMFAETRDDGPHISFNMEDHPVVTAEGVSIPPAGSHEMSVRVKHF